MFEKFKNAVHERINFLINNGQLYEVDVNPDDVWELYLNSFPQGTDLIYRERSSHNCSCCKNFIRRVGNVVGLINNKIHTIWDISLEGDDVSHYQIVANALHDFIKTKPINNVFFTDVKKVGTSFNYEVISEEESKKWHHFYYNFPESYVNQFPGVTQSNIKQTKDVIFRSLTELKPEALQDVIDLIEDKNLYRGEERLQKLLALSEAKELEELSDGASAKDLRKKALSLMRS